MYLCFGPKFYLYFCVSDFVGSHYVIEVSACARGLGTFHVPIAFHFRRSSGKEFHIIRFLNAKCVSDITEELKPTSPYKPPTRVAEYRETMEAVPGVKPPKYEQKDIFINEVQTDKQYVYIKYMQKQNYYFQ